VLRLARRLADHADAIYVRVRATTAGGTSPTPIWQPTSRPTGSSS